MRGWGIIRKYNGFKGGPCKKKKIGKLAGGGGGSCNFKVVLPESHQPPLLRKNELFLIMGPGNGHVVELRPDQGYIINN